MPANPEQPTTYARTGVDIDAGNTFAQRLIGLTRRTHRPEVVSGVGGFAGVSALPAGLKDPLLVSSTDGVGTKLKIAFLSGKHESVGIDLVAMGVNDIITVGADPLFFLDYFATGRLDIAQGEAVLRGIVAGCEQAGCALLGGETAEMPGFYAPGEYDLAGFAVGVVERGRLIDGRQTAAGDLVIGLPSSGLHANGFSLARATLLSAQPVRAELEQQIPELGRTLGEELLEPTIIYANAVRQLHDTDVRAIAHITGGGLIDNPPRCIPERFAFRLQTASWRVPRIMELIAARGDVPLAEMRRTFNMGLGLLVVVPAAQAEAVAELLAAWDARVVGEIVPRQDAEAVEFV